MCKRDIIKSTLLIAYVFYFIYRPKNSAEEPEVEEVEGKCCY